MVAFFCPPPFMLVGGGAPFPVVEAVATSQDGTSSSSQNVTLPSGIQSGELLLIFAAIQAAGITVSGISGWDDVLELEHADGTTGVILKVFSRVATGSEGSTATFSTSIARVSAHNSYRISGAGEIDHAEIGGRSDAPNPPSLSPSWGNGNTLWLTGAAIRQGVNGVINASPVNYSDLLSELSGGASSGVRVRMASARRELAAATEDPGSFTMSSVQDWVSATLAIAPA